MKNLTCILFMLICTDIILAQDTAEVKFAGIKEIDGYIHFVYRKQCRNSLSAFPSRIFFYSNNLTNKKFFKDCKYKLQSDEMYLFVDFLRTNQFLHLSDFNSTDSGYTLTRTIDSLLLNSGTYVFPNSALNPVDSVKSSKLQLYSYKVSHVKILVFDVDNAYMQRLFEKTFLDDIVAVSSKKVWRVGILFNNESDFLDYIKKIE